MKRQAKGYYAFTSIGRDSRKEEKETNVDLNQETNETRKEEKKVERKRVSFDLRTDLHKELKMQALLQDKNIYILIEEAFGEVFEGKEIILRDSYKKRS